MAVDFSKLNHAFTQKQLVALHHYIIYNSKIKAYRFAYDCSRMTETTLNKKCYDLWQKPYMKEAVALISKAALERQNETLKNMAIDRQWVLDRAAKMADFNIKKFIKIDEGGNAYYDFSTATDDDWYCINEYTVDVIPRGSGETKYTVDRIKLKTVDKLKALELVGRHVDVGAFKEDNSPTNIVAAIVTTEEYKRAREELMAKDDV